MSRARYDLVTGEPPPPIMAGVARLYTAEFFGMVHARLRDGGVASYWLPLMNLSAASAKSIVRGSCSAFEDCSLWHGTARNFMLLGSRGLRTPVGEQRFTAQWRDPRAKDALMRAGFELPTPPGSCTRCCARRACARRCCCCSAAIRATRPRSLS